jgi:glycosyltransferase involved in cell wall biosynthesis
VKNNLVTVVIPTYNRAHTILRAINSVLAQSYINIEIIVVDDGSTDETEVLLSELIQHKKLTYLKTENSGVAAARNYGVSNSTGYYLTFLDSDDEWLPNKLELQINYLKENQNIKIVYTDEIWIRSGVRVNPKHIHKKYEGAIFEQCILQCFIAPSSVMLERSLFLELNGFDEEFTVCEDYDLWLRISSQHLIGFLNSPLIIKHGGHEDQLSTKYFAMDMWRIKSLLNILEIRKLSESEQLAINKFIIEKGNILLKGYQKYKDNVNAETMAKILSRIPK